MMLFIVADKARARGDIKLFVGVVRDYACWFLDALFFFWGSKMLVGVRVSGIGLKMATVGLRPCTFLGSRAKSQVLPPAL